MFLYILDEHYMQLSKSLHLRQSVAQPSQVPLDETDKKYPSWHKMQDEEEEQYLDNLIE